MSSRNPFTALNDLPDEPRLGLRLGIIGVALLAIRYGWPRVAPASYLRASDFFFHYFRYLGYLAPHPSLLDLDGFLVGGGFVSVVCGAFVFFRRGFWWVAEHRKDKSITQLHLK